MNALPSPAVLAPRRDAAAVGERIDAAELRPDVVRSIYGQASPALWAYLLGGVLLVAIFAGVAPRAQLVAWSASFALVWLARWGIVRWYARTPHARRNAEASAWLARWCAGALAAAAVWGLAAWLFYGLGRTAQQATVMLLIYSYCVGAIQLLAWTYRVFIGFLSLCFVPLIARVLLSGDADRIALTVLLIVSYMMALALAWTYRRVFERAIVLKVRNERLAAQLKVEKQIADEARQVAETANRAKTQFFAAASHDLRQPLHAMGLFAEALRAKLSAPQPGGSGGGNAEVLHLVGSIDASVDALEGLFGELLDITKIDTGGVEPRPVDFSLRELFRRLALQYEPTAFEKGLALRFRGHHRHVFGDPVLVDRIVRNLVSNAIRYTRDGGILVGARVRAGRVLIQVWDTGVGIPKAEQPRVFDEFYQVQGGGADAPLDAHQAKGLGLGLAIVRRLALLTDAPLSLASEPGRGTVFTVSLPQGKPPPPSLAPAPIAAKPVLGLTLEHRRIVVVEDEAAVREGLSLLLTGWGAAVQSFETAARLEAWLAGPAATKPDLAIVDYRLPEGRTGLDALAALRAAFAAPPVPAIVVTGSTIGGHEDEAAAHDFHLLIKPVAPTKLRAMIAFKLGLK
ncbi:MAG TPA: ATP-binding protein [Methylibium sp.]|uniref:ATP-binding response regulator n=1 Tax=Methylibium sp. TaxID=2067992 RepID=UPI002DBC0348|nr:ATP-binding protein [Methylibium sp.]HEU4459816.1 ATP-binding protein [Methylibium sp.]